MNYKIIFIILTFSFVDFAMGQTIEELEAQLKSMSACKISLDHNACDLNILDPDIRDILIRINNFNTNNFDAETPKTDNSLATEQVNYFTGSISNADGKKVDIFGQGTWQFASEYFGLHFEDVIGIMNSDRTASIYINGYVHYATLIDGDVIKSTGEIRNVVQIISEGSVLKLDDGTLLEFSSYDKFDTGWWLPPYRVIVDYSSMDMWNISEGKKVWIQSIVQ
jgi:hypothetical protein